MIQGVQRVHGQREMCYSTYYSSVPFLISIFLCCRSLIGPGTHLALPCQQSPIWCGATVAHTSVCMHIHTHRCTETQYRTQTTCTGREQGGKGGNYSGAPKLETDPKKMMKDELNFLVVLQSNVPQFHTLSNCPEFPESHILKELLKKHTNCPSFICVLSTST